MQSERIAVVGGTGFLGSHLSEYLLAQGHEVLVVARGVRGTSALPDHERLRFEAANVVERSAVSAIFRSFRPDVVYHLACHSDSGESVDQMQNCLQVNALGTLNTLQAAISAGAGLFVFADSSKVYGNGAVPFRCEQPEQPICSYAISKAAGWRLCTLLASQTPIKLVGLRPTFIYGPRQNFNLLVYLEQAVRKGQPVRVQGGRQTRDLLFVDDAVRCFASVMHAHESWGRSLPIGGGVEINIADLCHEILHALGSDLDIFEDPENVRPTEIWRSFCDNAEIRRVCGWSPQINLREGLRRTFAASMPTSTSISALEAIA